MYNGYNNSNTRYVLKTFFYKSTIDQTNTNNYNDPMFGRLPRFLAESGKLLILADIVGDYKICIDKINCHKKLNIIPIEYWLSFNAIIKSFFKHNFP